MRKKKTSKKSSLIREVTLLQVKNHFGQLHDLEFHFH